MKLLHLLSSVKDWVLTWAASPFAPAFLFVNAFSEAIFFPIPPDLLLIAMCLGVGRSPLCFLFALITTAGSVTGGVAGYFIGLKGGRPVALKLFKKEKVAAGDALYARYGVWAVAVAGFTPVPYCIFTVLSGALRLKLITFVFVSVLSRGARFFLVATLLFFVGEPVRKYIENQKVFGVLTLVFMVLLLGGYIVLHKYSSHHIRKTLAEAKADEDAT